MDSHKIRVVMVDRPHVLEVHPEVTGEKCEREEDDGCEG